MDIWLIAATAATGFIAKKLQNVTKGKDSSEDVQILKSESPPKCLLSRLVRAKKANGENLDSYRADEPSTSGENVGNYDEIHPDSLFGLMPEFPEIEHEKWKTKQRTFVRRNQRYRRLMKPLNSLESCLMSQFHGEQMAMEDYMTSPFPSPLASVSRPLLVTDGTRVISKSTVDKAEHNCGISRFESLLEKEVGNEKTKSRKHGLSDATVLLQIGISIGIISSFMANQAEVSKVKQELKQTENLVHDLDEELEMKDSLIVKELDIEKACESSESISNIEAELEAELERLEINMNSTNIETRVADMIEMDSDFEVEFAQGELRADRIKGKRLDETESNQDPSGNSTPESGNYAVSPRELTLRLHKLINSRLEKRVEELETALQQSQMKVEQLVTESESKKNQKTNLSEIQQQQQPLVMNLAGEALDAFNDSYDDLMKINDDSDDDDDDGSHWSHHKEESKVQEQELFDFVGLEEEEEESSDFESEMEKQLIKQIVEKTKQGSPFVLNAQKMLFLMDESEHNL